MRCHVSLPVRQGILKMNTKQHRENSLTRSLRVREVQRSFDSARSSLRRLLASLRMTELEKSAKYMSQLNHTSLAVIQPELLLGESVLWTGQPSPAKIFHKEDALLIPFSLLWGGFAIFWEAGVSGFWTSGSRMNEPWTFGMIWGIPFVLVGQYLIWGRFIYAAWKKKRTYYAVTNRRVLAIQDGTTRRAASAYIDTLPTLTKEGTSGGIGTLRFAQADPLWPRGRGWGVWDSMSVGDTPVFIDIQDVDSVYRLVLDLREKSRPKAGS